MSECWLTQADWCQYELAKTLNSTQHGGKARNKEFGQKWVAAQSCRNYHAFPLVDAVRLPMLFVVTWISLVAHSGCDRLIIPRKDVPLLCLQRWFSLNDPSLKDWANVTCCGDVGHTIQMFLIPYIPDKVLENKLIVNTSLCICVCRLLKQ